MLDRMTNISMEVTQLPNTNVENKLQINKWKEFKKGFDA